MSREEILNDVIKAVKEIHPGWQMQGPIGPETFLGSDLALKSLDFVRLAAHIQQLYKKIIPFQELFVSNGEVREDIRLSEFAEFLDRHVNI